MYKTDRQERVNGKPCMPISALVHSSSDRDPDGS